MRRRWLILLICVQYPVAVGAILLGLYGPAQQNRTVSALLGGAAIGLLGVSILAELAVLVVTRLRPHTSKAVLYGWAATVASILLVLLA